MNLMLKSPLHQVYLQRCHFWVFVSAKGCTMAVSGRHQLEQVEQAGSWDGSPGAQPQPPPGGAPLHGDGGAGDGGGWNPPR